MDWQEPNNSNKGGYTTDSGWVSDDASVTPQQIAYQPTEWNYVDLHRENNSVHGTYISNPQDIPEAFQKLQQRQSAFDAPEEHNVNFIAFGKVHVRQSNDDCLPPRYHHRQPPLRPRPSCCPPGCYSEEPRQPWRGPIFTPPYWSDPKHVPYDLHPPIRDPLFPDRRTVRPPYYRPPVVETPPYPPWYNPRQTDSGNFGPPVRRPPMDGPFLSPFPHDQPINRHGLPPSRDSRSPWVPPRADQPLHQAPGQWYPYPYEPDAGNWDSNPNWRPATRQQQRQPWAQPRSRWQSSPVDHNLYARPRRWTTMAPEPGPRHQDWGMTIYAREYEPDSIHQQHARNPNARPYAHKLYGGQADVGHTLHGGMF
ncbi:MAG: hypothetical protein HY711_05645 [Candidatus Melainabacteria bacterium]|nr:hypothetical protein [Candidatus Melainabacteria bacterium]